jgi:hypothetical protein
MLERVVHLPFLKVLLQATLLRMGAHRRMRFGVRVHPGLSESVRSMNSRAVRNDWVCRNPHC